MRREMGDVGSYMGNSFYFTACFFRGSIGEICCLGFRWTYWHYLVNENEYLLSPSPNNHIKRGTKLASGTKLLYTMGTGSVIPCGRGVCCHFFETREDSIVKRAG